MRAFGSRRYAKPATLICAAVAGCLQATGSLREQVAAGRTVGDEPDEVVSSAGNTAIEEVRSATEDVRALVGELDLALAAEYPPEQRHGLTLAAIFAPSIRFFVAHLNGLAVGCGGVALFADFGEVKRMYVREAARGRGVAQSLLARIEQAAREAGLDVLRLETGDRQIAALRFYQRAGFRLRPAFGAYATMPPQAITTSVFLEKRLDATAG
jgi:putative acetyltransferase